MSRRSGSAPKKSRSGSRREATPTATGTAKDASMAILAGDSGDALLVLSALRSPYHWRRLSGRLPKELFPGDWQVLYQALRVFWDRTPPSENGDRPAPVRALLPLARELAGREWPRLRELTTTWLGLGIPKEKVLEAYLTRYVKRETLLHMANTILTDSQRKLKSGLNPEKYRSKLEMLYFSFQDERDRHIFYGDAPTKYQEHILGGRVPTGIPALDAGIRGGPGPGEIGIVLAPPKGGKTAVLINFDINAALAGFRVLHITLEIDRWVVLERLDMRLSGLSSAEVGKRWREVKKARQALSKGGGSIRIQDLSHEEVSVDRIGNLVVMHKPLDLLVLDYADLMAQANSIDRRGELGAIYRGLRRLASREQIPIWTASQANRQAIGAESFGMGEIAEDISKVTTADVVVACQQTEEEKLRGTMRLGLVATRGLDVNPEIPIRIDYRTMTMSPAREEPKDGVTETDQKRGDRPRRKSATGARKARGNKRRTGQKG